MRRTLNLALPIVLLLGLASPAPAQEYRIGEKTVRIHGPVGKESSWQPGPACELVGAKNAAWSQWFGYKKRMAEEAAKLGADTVLLVENRLQHWIDVEFYLCNPPVRPTPTPAPRLTIQKSKFTGVYKAAVLYQSSVFSRASIEKIRELAGQLRAELTLVSDLGDLSADETLLLAQYTTAFRRVEDGLERAYRSPDGLPRSRAVGEAVRSLVELEAAKQRYLTAAETASKPAP